MMVALKKQDKILILKWLVTLGIPLFLFLIPNTEIYTGNIKLFFVFTVMIILMVAFEFFDSLIPALLLPTLYTVFNVVEAKTAFSSWTSLTLYMILGAFVLTNVLDESGLLRRIAYWCIRKSGGSYTGVLYGTFLVGIVLAVMTFNSSYVIMVTLAYGICKAMGFGKSKEAAIVMMTGAMGALTVKVFIFNPVYVSLAQAGTQQLIPEFTIAWHHQLLYNFPAFIMAIVFIWLLTKIYHTKNIKFEGGREYFEAEYQKLGAMSTAEKKSMLILLAMMLYILTNPLHGQKIEYGFMLFPWLFYLPGINVGTKESIKNINMSVIFFVSACMSIGSVATTLGINTILSEMVTPIVSGMSPVLVLYVILIIGTLSNLVLTPTAMMGCLTTPLVQVALDTGMNVWPSILTIIYSTDMVFLPYEVAVLLIFFGFGMMSMSDFIKLYSLKNLVVFILFGLLQIPWWHLMGIF